MANVSLFSLYSKCFIYGINVFVKLLLLVVFYALLIHPMLDSLVGKMFEHLVPRQG